MKSSPPLQMIRVQSGAVLVVALIFMLVIMILGLAGSMQARLRMHIASNSLSSQIALQSAEATLKQSYIAMLNGNFDGASFSSNSNGYYQLSTSSAPIWQQNISTASFWTNTSKAIQGFQGSSQYPAAYVVEKLPNVIAPGQSAGNAGNYGQISNGATFRVTTWAVGPQGQSPVILQAVFAK